MERLTARDFDPAVLKLFDQYVHGQLSRRGFLATSRMWHAASPSRDESSVIDTYS